MPPSSLLLISSTLTSPEGRGSRALRRAVGCVRWGLSISLIKHGLIKGLRVPAQAEGLSHIMHKPLHWKKRKEKKSHSTCKKRLGQKWNLIQGEMLKPWFHIVLNIWQDLWRIFKLWCASILLLLTYLKLVFFILQDWSSCFSRLLSYRFQLWNEDSFCFHV